MKTITKAELDRYSKYATPTERNDLEERHRAGLCDAWCPICENQINFITAENLRRKAGKRSEPEQMAEYLDTQGALDFCTCGHHYNVHCHPPVAYGSDGFEEERWNLKCTECECQNFRPKE